MMPHGNAAEAFYQRFTPSMACAILRDFYYAIFLSAFGYGLKYCAHTIMISRARASAPPFAHLRHALRLLYHIPLPC